MTEPTPSPLTEASSSSLDELFARDPLNLSKGDRVEIVTELRRMREAWRKAEALGATKAPKPGKAPKVALSDEDLGL